MRNHFFAMLFLIFALSAAADDAAVDALIAQLGAEDPSTRDAAESKLIEMGPSAEARLRERQKNAEAEVKARIGRALDGIAAGTIANTDFEEIRMVTVGHSAIHAVVWSPDGKKILSAGWMGDVRIWDAETGKLVGGFQTPEGYVSSLAFGSDPNRLWIAAIKSVVCWDLANAKPIKTFPADGCMGLHMAPDGKHVVWQPYGEIQIVNTESLEVKHSIHVGDDVFLDPIGFTSDGAKLLVELKDHTGVFDLATGELEADNPLSKARHEGTIMTVGQLADGKVVTVSREGQIRWGEHTETCREYCWELAIAPGGKRFAIAGKNPEIRVLDAEGKEIATYPMGYSKNQLAWSPDGKRIAAGNEFGRLAIWTEGGAPPLEFAGHAQDPERAEFSPDSSMVAGCIGGLGVYWTTFVDIESGTAVDVEGLFGAQPGRSGTEFVSTERFNVVTWDGKTGKRSGKPREGKGGPRREVAYTSPDGTLAWTEGYQVPDDKRFHSFTDKAAPVVTGSCGCSWSSASWSCDSEFVAISGTLDSHGNIGSLTVVRRNGKVEFRAEYAGGGGAPCWTPDGAKLFWSHGEELLVFDRANLKEPEQRKADYSVAGFLDEVSLLGVREKGEKERELVLIHLPTMRIARIWPLRDYGRVSVAPDRKKIMVLSQEGAAVLRVVKRERK